MENDKLELEEKKGVKISNREKVYLEKISKLEVEKKLKEKGAVGEKIILKKDELEKENKQKEKMKIKNIFFSSPLYLFMVLKRREEKRREGIKKGKAPRNNKIN